MVSLARTMFIVMVALLAGCAPTKQARSMEKSGFLGDLYPLMQKGEKEEALLFYKNPRVVEIPRGTYKKMLLEPVTIWGPPAVLSTTPRQKDLQQVANMLYSLAYDSLSKDYEIVPSPGPNTLRIQAAITRADQSYVVLRASLDDSRSDERVGPRLAAQRPRNRQKTFGFRLVRFVG